MVERFPNAKFLFVGDGDRREAILAQAEEAGMRDRIVFTGLVDASRIPVLIAAMDVLVHASLREGLARVLPQALISGKPVVSFDVDGAREVCITGETGYLVPPADTDALLEALTTVLSAPDRGRSLGEEGRRRFADQFRWQTMVRGIHQEYQRLLAAPS